MVTTRDIAEGRAREFATRLFELWNHKLAEGSYFEEWVNRVMTGTPEAYADLKVRKLIEQVRKEMI